MISDMGRRGIQVRSGFAAILRCVIRACSEYGVLFGAWTDKASGAIKMHDCCITNCKDVAAVMAYAPADKGERTITMADCKIRECKLAVNATGSNAKIFCDKSNSIEDCATGYTVENDGQILTADPKATRAGNSSGSWESRGICKICGKEVTTFHLRVKDADGYLHAECNSETNARKDPSGLHAGDRVELHSLQAKPEYNGNSGILVAFNVVSERWQIDLDVGGSLYVKAANLTKAVACEDPKVDASAMLCARNACFLRNTQAS